MSSSFPSNLLLALLRNPFMATAWTRRCLHHQQVQTVQAKALTRFRALLRSAPRDALPRRVLITGALGQLGRSLAPVLSALLGAERVLLSDIFIRPDAAFELARNRYCHLDILDRAALEQIVVNEHIDTVVHLSALLSAVAENNVEQALRVNCQGVQNVLQAAHAHHLRLFIPSTIGAFGPLTPRDRTPDITVQRPTTVYGVTKVYAELLGEYYAARYGLDFRSLRLPGIISTVQPGGGTTDYAIQMFWDVLSHGHHVCYLRPETRLPMLFDEDCMAALVGILFAPSERLRLRTYNVTGFSCSPEELADAIRQHLPHFEISYEICPVRQRIADSWPRSLDDTNARAHWGWRPEYTLEGTVHEMLARLGKQCIAEPAEDSEKAEKCAEKTVVAGHGWHEWKLKGESRKILQKT